MGRTLSYVTLRWGLVLQISSDRDDRMGAKIKTPKNPQGFRKTQKNPWTKLQTPKNLKQNSEPKKFQEELPGRGTRKVSRIFRLFSIPQKSRLKSSYPPKNVPKFSYPKIPKSKISNPKKSFDHPCHLNYGVFPLELLCPT